MKFTKMQGAGNDFIIINNMEEKLSVEKLGEANMHKTTFHRSGRPYGRGCTYRGR